MKILERNLRRAVGKAIGDFGLIENNDSILVALSGGKDSWTLLHLLGGLRERAPVYFSLVAVVVHPGFEAFRTDRMESYLHDHGYAFRIVHAPIHALLKTKLKPGDNPCSLCSRIRRGTLYTQARELGCTKIALGHHREDFVETLLLNMFYTGRIKAMSPLLKADDGKNIVIRPLVYAAEDDIAGFASQAGFPILPSTCPSCGSRDMQRARIKSLLARLEQEQPGIKSSLLAALGAVDGQHLLVRRRPPDAGSGPAW